MFGCQLTGRTLKGELSGRSFSAIEPISYDENTSRDLNKRILWLTDYGHWSTVWTGVIKNISQLKRSMVNHHTVGDLLPHNEKRQFKLRVVTLSDEPFVTIKDENIAGHNMDLLNALAKRAGFTYSIKSVEDGVYGSFDNSTNAWNGLIGVLQRGEADIAVAPITVTSEREEVVRFLPCFAEGEIRFIYKHLATSKSSEFSFAFLSPFDTSLYVAILAAVFMVSYLLNILSKVSPYGNRGEFYHLKSGDCEHQVARLASKKEEADRGMGLNNAIYFVWASLFWQSPDTVPRSPSQRLLTLAWYLSAVVFVATYTANMVSVLASMNVPVHVDIDSLAQLMTHTEFLYGTTASSSVVSLLSECKMAFACKLNLKISSSGKGELLGNLSQGIDRASEGNFAFFWDSQSLLHAERESGCVLKSVPASIGHSKFAFAVRKDSPHFDELSQEFDKLKAGGYMGGLRRKYRLDVDSCPTTREYNPRAHQLTVTDLRGLFYLVAMSVFVGSVVLLFEWLFAAYIDVRTTKRSAMFPTHRRRHVEAGSMREALKSRLERVKMGVKEDWSVKVMRRFSKVTFHSQIEANRIVEDRINSAYFKSLKSTDMLQENSAARRGRRRSLSF